MISIYQTKMRKLDQVEIEKRNSRIKICECCKGLLSHKVYSINRRMPYYRTKGRPSIVNLPEVVLIRHGVTKCKGDMVRFRDGDRTNCRIDNLYFYPMSLHAIGRNNIKKNSAVGVYKLNSFYRAVITMNGMHVYSKLFKTFEEAKFAHDEKIKQLKMEIT
jgi:hypothetical protein